MTTADQEFILLLASFVVTVSATVMLVVSVLVRVVTWIWKKAGPA
jgi:hypothetical protein